MKKLFIVFLLSAVLLSSCAMYRDANDTIAVGMTKEQMIGVMGDAYTVESLSQTAEGVSEALTFSDAGCPKLTLFFRNGKLTEIRKYLSGCAIPS